MSLQDLANLGEFIGAVGVVLSLIYLAVQIRQNTAQLDHNTQSVRTSTLVEARRIATEFTHLVAQTMAEVMSRGVAGADLSIPERMRFHSMLSALFNDHETMFMLYRQGTIQEEQFAPWRQSLEQLLAVPSVRKWWMSTPTFTTSFREFIADLSEGEPSA